MRDVSCKLLSISTTQNSIGVQKQTTVETEIPIIKVEDVRANEFYKADEQGYKPTLRLRISSFNYEGQEELEYMNTIYTVIRTQEITVDELILICERKAKNVKSSQAPASV